MGVDRPPRMDASGYGIRVPGLLVSPWAKPPPSTGSFSRSMPISSSSRTGFLGGQRLNPKTDGRPDSRPTVRETVPILGDMEREFDFNQDPRPPVILDPTP